MKHNRSLWTIQGLLAALFFFAGAMKVVLPIDQLSGPIALPGPFLRFIDVSEILGATGLVLPWLLRIQPALTPIAAIGLLAIMIGAVVVTAMAGSIVGATLPLIVGVALTVVAAGRAHATARATAQ